MTNRQVYGSACNVRPLGSGLLQGTSGQFSRSPPEVVTKFPTKPIPTPFIPNGVEPKEDGECNTYSINRFDASFFYPPFTVDAKSYKLSPTERTRGPRTAGYTVLFVNGQSGNPTKHMYQSLATAILSGGPVIGVYNSSTDFAGKYVSLALDTLHSAILDKTTSSLVSDVLAEPFETLGASLNRLGFQNSGNAVMDAGMNVMKFRLRMLSSPATATLFEQLCHPANSRAHIVAHSQGNIIAANALNAVVALRGADAIKDMKMIAIASPVTYWTEAKSIVTEYNFSNDLVALLSLNWMFKSDKELALLPKESRPHAPDYRGTHLVNRGLAENDKSETVARFADKFSPLTHSFYAYVGELWDDLVTEFP